MITTTMTDTRLHDAQNNHQQAASDEDHGGSTATAVPKQTPRTAPPRPKHLPQWRVLLHNDDVNEFMFVIETVVDLVHIRRQDATLRVIEAHNSGLSLLTTTHREHAELLQQQFMTKKLIVTLEPAD